MLSRAQFVTAPRCWTARLDPLSEILTGCRRPAPIFLRSDGIPAGCELPARSTLRPTIPFTETAKLLEDLGHEVEWGAPQYAAAAYAAAFVTVMTANCAAYMEDGARLLGRTPGPDNLAKINLWVLQEGRNQTGMDLVRAQG